MRLITYVAVAAVRSEVDGEDRSGRRRRRMQAVMIRFM